MMFEWNRTHSIKELKLQVGNQLVKQSSLFPLLKITMQWLTAPSATCHICLIYLNKLKCVCYDWWQILGELGHATEIVNLQSLLV